MTERSPRPERPVVVPLHGPVRPLPTGLGPGSTTVSGHAGAQDEARERRAADRRTLALAVFTRRLVAATDVRTVARVVAESGPRVLEALTCGLAVWDRELGRSTTPDRAMRLLTRPTGRPVPGDATFGAGERSPVGDAMRSAAAVIVGDTGATTAYAHLSADWAAAGAGAVAAAPLLTARGEVLGVLDVAWSTPVTPTPSDVAALTTLADICSQALHRALLHDAQNALVRALQLELLPVMPVVDGLGLAARYLPASDHTAFGGDWYDAVVLGPGRTAIVVGDVVGHGVHAAARMARLRGALDALIHLDADLGTLFARAHDLLRSWNEPFIGTAAVFVVDTTDEIISYVHAGHPPALLRPPGGTAAPLHGGHAPGLGVPTDPITPGLAPFPSGSVLLAYTDGLVERRGRALEMGVDRLAVELDAALAGSWAPDAEVLGRVVDAAVRDGRPRDDVAAVLVRRH